MCLSSLLNPHNRGWSTGAGHESELIHGPCEQIITPLSLFICLEDGTHTCPVPPMRLQWDGNGNSEWEKQ